jgi:hypothetical protein
MSLRDPSGLVFCILALPGRGQSINSFGRFLDPSQIEDGDATGHLSLEMLLSWANELDVCCGDSNRFEALKVGCRLGANAAPSTER